MVFLVGVAVVIAYGSGQPTVHGHDAGEVNISTSISYADCRWINIYSRTCNSVPGCSFSGARLTLTMPAPWVVVGGNYNSPDYADGLYVCQMVIG